MSDYKVDIAELMEEAAASNEPPPTADLEQVMAKAKRLIEIETELEELSEKEKKLKKERELVRIKQLPDMMFSLNMTSVGIGNRTVKIEPMIQANLPKDPTKKIVALNTLVDMKEGGVISRNIALHLPKGDAVVAEKTMDFLKLQFPSLLPELQDYVHPQTYLALCKRLIKSGVEVDKDKLGIYVGQIARVEEV